MIQEEITLDEIKQGESATLQFTYREEDTGDLVDMSSYTFTLAIRNSLDQTTDDISKTDDDFVKTDAANGMVTVTLSASDTAALSAETYHVEVKAVYGTSTIKSKKDIKLPVLESIT